MTDGNVDLGSLGSHQLSLFSSLRLLFLGAVSHPLGLGTGLWYKRKLMGIMKRAVARGSGKQTGRGFLEEAAFKIVLEAGRS